MNNKKGFLKGVFGIKEENIHSSDSSVKENANAAVLVLGPGCRNCQILEANVKEALKIMDSNVTVGHVTDFAEIAAYGVMSTPALVINKKVVSAGKVLRTDELIPLLERAGKQNGT